MRAALQKRIAAAEPELLERALLLLEPPADSRAIFCANDAILHLAPLLRGHEVEHFAVLFLNRRHRPLGCEVLSKGSQTVTIVDPRTVLRRALVKNAASIIVAHNHPSGDLMPSREDIAITKRLADAGAIVGVRLLDHLVVTDTSFTSLAERGDFTPGA